MGIGKRVGKNRKSKKRAPAAPGRSGFRRVVLGVDGSAHSRRAAAFLTRLQPPRGGRVTVVRVVEAVAATLARAGWRAHGVVRTGLPVAQLLAAIRAERADVLALGARGAGALEHFLLGSVAEAALKHAPVEVLIVK